MNIKPENIFQTIPDDLSEEEFTQLVNGKNTRIERIVSQGHTTAEQAWYDQPDNEWVIVLKGEAKIAFTDGRVVHLKVGDYLDLPAHCKHRVSWTSIDTETIWLAVHYQ